MRKISIARWTICAPPGKFETALYARYLRQHPQPRACSSTTSPTAIRRENRTNSASSATTAAAKKGELQIVLGLLTDAQGEPLAVRVFAGNTADPATVVDQVKILQEQFQVREFVFVGDRGMVKSNGIQALQEAHLRYITALTDPQIRRLLNQKVLQLDLFSEQICEVEAGEVRYVLRKNEKEAARERHRLEDKMKKLAGKITSRNEQVKTKPRCQPEAGRRTVQQWAERHKLNGLVELQLEGPTLVLRRHEEKITRALELAGCYVVTTDVLKESMSAQEVHDSALSVNLPV